MVGELNPYELFNMALLAPDEELMAVLQGKSDRFPQDVAFSALKKRRQMKTAVQGVQAQNELSGVAGLPADNMAQMAGGGIVAFAGPDGSFVTTDDQENERRREELQNYVKRFGLAGAKMIGAPTAMAYDIGQLGSMPGQYLGYISGLKKREPEFTSLTKRLYTEEAPLEKAYRQKQAFAKTTAGGESDYASAPAPSVTQVDENLLNYPSVPSLRPAPAPRVGGPRSAAPAPAPAPAAAPVATTMRPAGAAAPVTDDKSAASLIENFLSRRMATEPKIAGSAAGSDDTVFNNFYSLAAGMTRPEQEKLDALLKAREDKITSGKEERKGEARGLAALQAASELLQSGRAGAASRGAAFGVSAKQAEKYLDNEQKIQDRLDESGIAAANARLANKQGNVKLAAEMMGQAQARGLKAAELAYDNEYKRMDSMLKATVLDETKRHNMATEAAERAKTNVMAQAYSSHAGLYGAQAELAKAQAEALRTHPKGSLTEAQRANIQNQIRDDVRAVMQDPTRVLGLRKDPRFQGMSDAEIETALKNQLLQESGLLPATAINPIQNPAFSSTLPPGAVVRQIPPR
jgi:hypothetical protein